MGRRKKGPAARASSRPCLDSAAATPRSRSLAAGAQTGARRGSSNRPLSARTSAPFASNPAARRRRRRRGEGGSRSGGAAKEHDLDPLRAREAEEEVDRPAREPGRQRARGAVAAPRRAGRRCPGARWRFGRRGAAGRRPAGSTLLRRLLEGGEERRGELRPPRAQGVVLRARSYKDRDAVLRGLAVAAMRNGSRRPGRRRTASLPLRRGMDAR
ncbi:unnamed protein product [Urochloa humidicola]